ncbi:MAG: aspartate/glutamate racemase family protein [Pseudomonadota bacterium]
MRIALLNPNTSAETTTVMVGIAKEAAGSGITIDGVTARYGAPLITDPTALDIAAEAVAALAPALSGFDAVILSGFGDPGIEALRAALDVPVTGIVEAGMAEAAAFGDRFAVVTTTPELAGRIAQSARVYGHKKFCGTWTTPGDPVTLTARPADLENALAVALQTALDDANAHAVIIGGGPLAVAARALAKVSPVPLVEPIPAAVRLTMARLGLENVA